MGDLCFLHDYAASFLQLLDERLQLLRFCMYVSVLKSSLAISNLPCIALNKHRAHTILEIVRARWGTPAHIVFCFFCVLTNCEYIGRTRNPFCSVLMFLAPPLCDC